MENVVKVIFDPLAASKDRIGRLLRAEESGTAHPFSPEKALKRRTETGIKNINISDYPESFFYNAVDLGEMGEVLLRRMAGFSRLLHELSDFQILQAPASTFRVPLVKGSISILALSAREPTYWDFCFADADGNAACWLEKQTIPGMTHSGDHINGQDLLDYVTMDPEQLTDQDICVFLSGYQKTHISQFQGTFPALLVADQVEKILYIVAVPLDKATVGEATICCPLVFRRDGDGLLLSILPKATTDVNIMCHGNKVHSPAFAEAIRRANFELPGPAERPSHEVQDEISKELRILALENEQARTVLSKTRAVFTTCDVKIDQIEDVHSAQIIRFGTGLHFAKSATEPFPKSQSTEVILPVVSGTVLEGPLLLATGTAPSNVPFSTERALHAYYEGLESVVFIVNDRMIDNAHNLAPPYRFNGVFVLQLNNAEAPADEKERLETINSANINAITALSGPQSLVLIQIKSCFYFYRGLANNAHLQTRDLRFGDDVTDMVASAGGLHALLEPQARRIVNLEQQKMVLLPRTGQEVAVDALIRTFHDVPVDDLVCLSADVQDAITQLQVLLKQVELQKLCGELAQSLKDKTALATKDQREEYLAFFMKYRNTRDPKTLRQKQDMLGALRARNKEIKALVQPLVDSLSNIVTLRATSKRTHDLHRMMRHAKIYGNVRNAHSMDVDNVAQLLEDHAGEMGVMLLNIKNKEYKGMLWLLGCGEHPTADSSCELDRRILHLAGLDAGVIMEQSQQSHHGPLRSLAGSSTPTMAFPYLNRGTGDGSMLAWVCWDEFVQLKDPSKVRWVEKCNDSHIAALRIIMRSTLATAVSDRELHLEPSSNETGYLMGALLMSAMSKLAATKPAAPTGATCEEDCEEDTVTKLMRGLFGNLLTLAGSGVRPQSMVWQLMGTNASLDIPSAPHEWLWYDAVVSMYHYTAWPRHILRNNIERFLDKLILRAVTRGESHDSGNKRKDRMLALARFCRLRNVELEHSRTIVTVLQRMLTIPSANTQDISQRLMACLPGHLERQSSTYTRLLAYLEYLSFGGARRQGDDAVVASTYTRRSAAYAQAKSAVSKACTEQDWATVKAKSKELILQHKAIAEEWSVDPKKLLLQNHAPYLELARMKLKDMDQRITSRLYELTRSVLSDAEQKRVPWQVGKEGQYSPMIEPLDETFVHELVMGAAPAEEWTEVGESDDDGDAGCNDLQLIQEAPATKSLHQELAEMQPVINAKFMHALQKKMKPEDVCEMLRIPVSTMRLMAQELNADFNWEELGMRFKRVMLDLLKTKSRRAERKPALDLLAVIQDKQLDNA